MARANILVALLVVIYWRQGVCKVVEIQCTPRCRCDLYEDFRRTTCHFGKMVNIKDNVSNYTEILDFSYNYVSVLVENEFYNDGLSSLKLLNLSHNHIKDINIRAFSKMDELKTLDLSHNAMQYILKEWFWELSSLEELYMNNNNLGKLRDPIFESGTLRILDLSYCQIPSLHTNLFGALPNLETLDLRNNQLNEIQQDVLFHNPHLTKLLINGNYISCNDIFQDLLIYCKELGVYYDRDYCKAPENVVQEEKFQRMIIPEQNTRNSWLYNNTAVQNTIEIMKECPRQPERGLMLEILEMSPVLAIIFIVTLGFLTGLLVGCTCEIKSGRKKGRHRSRRSFSFVRYIPNDYYRHGESLILNCHHPCESTPMTERRQF